MVIELQQLDTHIAELGAQIDSLPAQIQTPETQLHEFIQSHEERKQRLAKNQKERKDLEVEIQAVQAALNKINSMILEGHLNSCLITAVRGEIRTNASVC
jgi:chromosome segregation ATPase